MTNFIYNMQDELFHLNMILPVGEFAPIKKLVDHIEAQGKQLRELNATITKRDATIEKYEREKESLRKANNHLFKKVNELNEGIRDSEDLTWKQKYDALLQSSEQAIGALQKKCQEYKNSESDAITSATLVKENKELKERNKKLDERRDELKKMCEDIMVEKNAIIKGLEEKNKKIEHNYNELINQRNALVDENKKLERANLDLGDTIGWYVEDFKKLKEDKKVIENNFAYEMQVSKDLNVIINSKNKLLDKYMTKCNNLEHNYKEEVRMKEQFKTICFRHERTIESQNSTIKYLKGLVVDYKNLEKENGDLRRRLSIIEDTIKK